MRLALLVLLAATSHVAAHASPPVGRAQVVLPPGAHRAPALSHRVQGDSLAGIRERAGGAAERNAGAGGIAVAVGAVAVGAGGFGDAWRAGAGVAGRGEVDAYGGVARGAVAVLPFEAATDAAPSFLLAVVTAGWGARARVGRAEIVAGPTVGVVHFEVAADDEAGGVEPPETETAVGAFAGVRVPVARRVVVWADAEALRVALATPRGLLAVGGGVALRLDVPAAVAGVFR